MEYSDEWNIFRGAHAGAETIISQDVDFDNIKGLNRKWMIIKRRWEGFTSSAVVET